MLSVIHLSCTQWPGRRTVRVRMLAFLRPLVVRCFSPVGEKEERRVGSGRLRRWRSRGRADGRNRTRDGWPHGQPGGPPRRSGSRTTTSVVFPLAVRTTSVVTTKVTTTSMVVVMQLLVLSLCWQSWTSCMTSPPVGKGTGTEASRRWLELCRKSVHTVQCSTCCTFVVLMGWMWISASRRSRRIPCMFRLWRQRLLDAAFSTLAPQAMPSPGTLR